MLLQSLNFDRLKDLPKPGDPAPAPSLAPAVLMRRRKRFLSAEGQLATPLEEEAQIGTNDLVEVNFLERCRLVQPCIGRIRIKSPGRSGSATGFLIGPGLLMTNHHVFPGPELVSASTIEFGYWYDVAGELPDSTDEFALEPGKFFVNDEDLDVAVVAVAARSIRGQAIEDRGYLRLIPDTGKVRMENFVTILQHPDGNPMCIALRENKVVRAEDAEPFIWYAADTAHGSSGSPVFNDTFQIVALHASGHIKRDSQNRYLRKNGSWVTSLDGLRESDVVWESNVGFRTSRICTALLNLAKTKHPDRVPAIEAAMAGGDVLSRAVARAKSGTVPSPIKFVDDCKEAFMPENPEEPETMTKITSSQSGLIIPLQLRIGLEYSGRVPSSSMRTTGAIREAISGLETEAFKFQIPIIYDHLESRAGFDPNFLKLQTGKVPMPVVTERGREALAPLLDKSGVELKYHRFSIWMHKTRRLALFTASNVDWRARKKKVDGKSTSRKALAGFPENEQIAEQWVDDPRIDPTHQLPDIFYTEDRGAFDKGHIVRRDDMCWGTTYEEIQKSNGDTFHVTNCSPQTKEFNQGPAGDENWGDLEEYIAKATKKDAETACIFAGPIFGEDDRWFRGKDAHGPARVQIPSRFWKIVVVNDGAKPKAYGFILEQDVRPITEKEFSVTDEWLGAFKPITEIASQMRDWLDLGQLAACDAFKPI